MTCSQAVLSHLRRPRLLITAARFGLSDYDRSRDLPRILNSALPRGAPAVIEQLICEEAGLEETRRAGVATYSVVRHVDVLIALMGEARLLPRTAQSVR